MSFRDPLRGARTSPARLAGNAAAVLVAAVLAAACTVRPLYTDHAAATAGLHAGTAAQLRSISISQPTTREGQEVRNQLIFLFGGGAGQPAAPAYEMDLTVLTSVLTPAVIQVGTTTQEPTASSVQMRAIYTVADNTGRVVARGNRVVTSAFDLPQQQFAALRAQRNAEDRAARELAQLVHLSVTQEMARPDR